MAPERVEAHRRREPADREQVTAAQRATLPPCRMEQRGATLRGRARQLLPLPHPPHDLVDVDRLGKRDLPDQALDHRTP